MFICVFCFLIVILIFIHVFNYFIVHSYFINPIHLCFSIFILFYCFQFNFVCFLSCISYFYFYFYHILFILIFVWGEWVPGNFLNQRTNRPEMISNWQLVSLWYSADPIYFWSRFAAFHAFPNLRFVKQFSHIFRQNANGIKLRFVEKTLYGTSLLHFISAAYWALIGWNIPAHLQTNVCSDWAQIRWAEPQSDYTLFMLRWIWVVSLASDWSKICFHKFSQIPLTALRSSLVSKVIGAFQSLVNLCWRSADFCRSLASDCLQSFRPFVGTLLIGLSSNLMVQLILALTTPDQILVTLHGISVFSGPLIGLPVSGICRQTAGPIQLELGRPSHYGPHWLDQLWVHLTESLPLPVLVQSVFQHLQTNCAFDKPRTHYGSPLACWNFGHDPLNPHRFLASNWSSYFRAFADKTMIGFSSGLGGRLFMSLPQPD